MNQLPRAIHARNIETEEVRWAWKPYVPYGILTLIAGIPGQGKSMLTCHLAAIESHKGKVIMSNSEDDYSMTVKPRLEAAGANMENIIFLQPTVKLPRDSAYLVDLMKKHKVTMVTLDPMQDHLEISIYSPRITQILAPLSKETAELGCAFVMVTHIIKSTRKGDNPLFAIGGTAGGMSRVARLVHIFGPHPKDKDKRAMAFAKANFVPMNEQRKTAVFHIVDGVLQLLETDESIIADDIIHPPPTRSLVTARVGKTMEDYKRDQEDIMAKLRSGAWLS